MRTTLNIDDDLYRRTKAFAALQGQSVTSVVEEALRVALRMREEQATTAPMPVSTRSSGLSRAFAASGVDLSDTSAVLDYLDGLAR